MVIILCRKNYLKNESKQNIDNNNLTNNKKKTEDHSLVDYKKFQKRLKKARSVKILITTHALIRCHQRIKKFIKKRHMKLLLSQILTKIKHFDKHVIVKKSPNCSTDSKFRVTYNEMTFVLHLPKNTKDCSLVTCWKIHDKRSKATSDSDSDFDSDNDDSCQQ